MEPKFYKDADGNIVELKPVKVDRKGLVKELAEAQAAAKQIDDNVAKLETEVETLTMHLSQVNTVLAKQLDDQEAAHELVAFRTDRLNGFDAPHPLNPPATDAAPSAVLEDVDGDPDVDDDADEDLAEGDEPEEDADEPAAPSEDVEVPIRRRASV